MGLLGSGAPILANDPGEIKMNTPFLTQPMQMPKLKPKFFQQGGIGRGIAGTIGDFLMQNAGMQPVYQPMVQRRQEMDQQDQQYQRRRGDELNDRIAIEKYKRENPEPRYFEANNGDQYQIGPDGQPKRVFEDTTEPARTSALEQNIEYIRSLDPSITPEQAAQAALRALSGYQYSPEAIKQREESQIRIKKTVPGKAPSSGGGTVIMKLPSGFILD